MADVSAMDRLMKILEDHGYSPNEAMMLPGQFLEEEAALYLEATKNDEEYFCIEHGTMN